MAKGDIFGINVKIDNKYDVLIAGVCDSDIINNNQWGNESVSGYGDTFVDAAKNLDAVIQYPWQISKIPLYLYPDWDNDIFNDLLSNTPGIYLIDSPDLINNKKVYYSDEVIPPNAIGILAKPLDDVSNTYAYNDSLSLTAIKYFPIICGYTLANINYGEYCIGFPFMVAPDSFINDGVIDMSNVDNLYYVFIQILRYVDTASNNHAYKYSVVGYFRGYAINITSKNFWNGKKAGTIEINPDPYKPGGDSSPGGGGGNFDNTSDPVDIPGLPSLSAISTGFITLFNPSLSELQNLANYMWGDLFDVSTWKKIFADPMDAILGLSIVPVNVTDGGQADVVVGNISTGISMNKAASQYVSVDCGIINANEYWGSYLDYDPYTRLEIYLPYIGTHPLSADDVIGKTIHVVYHVDILSGACCAYVKCGDSVLYTFVGQCSASIPITGNDWTNVINGALSVGAAIGTMVATGGATAPMVAGTVASTAVNSLKPSVEKSGAISGMGGMLGIQKPYLIVTRPRQALPYGQNRYIGYPSFITVSLAECNGYTEVESIHLEGIPATQEEISEIENLLKSGVIF